jgi:hypothetical protein
MGGGKKENSIHSENQSFIMLHDFYLFLAATAAQEVQASLRPCMRACVHA